MKNLILIFLIYLIGCASTDKQANTHEVTQAKAANEINPTTSNLTLADYLKRIAGVHVSQNGPHSTRVLIRGNGSLGNENEPFFILDGTPVGYGYDRVAPLVDPNDIGNIRVLKSGSETAAYGLQGNNGVIIITTKKN